MKINNLGTDIVAEEFTEKISPISGNTLYRIPLSRKAQIDDVFENAVSARKALDEIGIFGRTVILEKAINKLIQNRDKIVNLVIQETGKSQKLSESEFDAAIMFGESLLGLARFQDGITIPSANSKKFAYEKRIPFGVAGLIVSYNTPMPNYAWKVFPSFLSGNVSILKPSPHTSGSAQLFVESFENIGLPKFSLCLIHGDEESGKILCDQDLDLLSFTGSYRAGIEIQTNSCKKMRKTIFELGGNNCIILNENIDLEEAIEAVISSAFSNSGQRCAAGSRLIMHKDIAPKALAKIKERLLVLKAGIDNEAYLGPVIDNAAVTRYQEFLRTCVNQNKVITRGKKLLNSNEFTLEPVLVEGFKKNDPLFATEIFAPVLRTAIFKDKQEAVSLANNSKYSLTSAVWGKDINEIDFYINNLNAGLINVNGPTHGAEFQFPFGGIGYSGNGSKEVGYQCLDEYSHHKLVTITHHG